MPAADNTNSTVINTTPKQTKARIRLNAINKKLRELKESRLAAIAAVRQEDYDAEIRQGQANYLAFVATSGLDKIDALVAMAIPHDADPQQTASVKKWVESLKADATSKQKALLVDREKISNDSEAVPAKSQGPDGAPKVDENQQDDGEGGSSDAAEGSSAPEPGRSVVSRTADKKDAPSNADLASTEGMSQGAGHREKG